MMHAKTEPIRWGILGCSRVAQNRWIPAIRAASLGQVAAIASRQLPKAKKWAHNLHIPRAFGSYRELLDDPEIDAVFVGLPNSLHAQWTRDALDARKHVLCDKPLALNAGQGAELANAAEKNRQLLLEGFIPLFHRQFRVIDQWLDEGRIGSLRCIRIAFSFLLDRPDDFRNDPNLGGGALLDLGCYCVHVIRHLARAPVRRVRAFARPLPTGADATTFAVLECDNDVTASLDCSFEYRGDQFLHIAGTQGRIIADRPVRPIPGSRLILETADDRTVETLEPIDQYAACVEHFHHLLLADLCIPSPARDSVQTLAILDAIAHAAATDATVTL